MEFTGKAGLPKFIKSQLSLRKWSLLLAGTVLAGIGVALLLNSNLGASPVDALFAGVAARAGFSVGTVMIVLSLIMLTAAFFMGTTSGLGTVVCFFGIGVIVDLTNTLLNHFNVQATTMSIPARGGVWLVGAFTLGTAAAFVNASGLGASAYDQFVRACTRFGVPLHIARIVLDVIVFIIALLIGGAIGFGTLGLMIVIPLMLKIVYPRLSEYAHAVGPMPEPKLNEE